MILIYIYIHISKYVYNVCVHKIIYLYAILISHLRHLHTSYVSDSICPSEIACDLTNGPLIKVAIEILKTQVFSGSVQWVLLEISWTLVHEQ